MERRKMKKIFSDQKDFFDRINAVEYVDGTHVDRIKDYCLGINKNVVDLMNALDWDPSKEHKTNSMFHQKIEATDAVVDIMKYAMNVCHEYEISYNQLIQAIAMKSRTIDQKFNQRLFITSPAFFRQDLAFIIDIDGVLSDIGKAYRTYFSEKTGIDLETFYDFKIWSRDNIDLYKRLKEEYRLGGYKMRMPVVENALELLKTCKERGIVSLLSNRPVKTYPILYMYTVEWLFNNGMLEYVDMMHFTELGEKKYFFDRFNGKEVYFLEDNWYNLIDTDERPNVCNIFVRNETNEFFDGGFFDAEECKPVDNLQEAIAFIKEVTNDKNDNDCRDSV
jgi:hypothetical protein